MRLTVWQMQDLRTNNIPSNSLLDKIREEIKPYSESPYLDALVLVSHITSKTKTDLLTYPDLELTAEQTNTLTDALNRIKDGVPLPYILGTWDFYHLKFKVTPDVLIPRPESEWLVERGLTWLMDRPKKRTCLDLGTGSGCLAISLADKIKDLRVLATDRSYQALLIAQENARHHQVLEQILFVGADLIRGIRMKFDLLIANLPYIPTHKLKTLPVYHKEPQLALDGGPDGLSYIKESLMQASGYLNPNGLILLELDETNGKNTLELAEGIFPVADIHLSKDLSGQDRYLEIQNQ